MRHRLRHPFVMAFTLASLILGGCASLGKPSDEKFAAMPIVELGGTPPSEDFIFKIPAGRPIPVKVTLDGNALETRVEQTINAAVPKDIYLYKRWVSDDGRQWRPAEEVFEVSAKILLPSDQSPKGGDIHLTVERKDKH